jgi:hypothetical protein
MYEPLALLTKARRVSVRSHDGFAPDCLRRVGRLGSALAVSDMRESIGQLFAAFDELHLEMALGCDFLVASGRAVFATLTPGWEYCPVLA